MSDLQSDTEIAADDEEQRTMFDSLRNDWEAEDRAPTDSDVDSELGSDADWDMDEDEGLESMKVLARQVDLTDDGEWLPPKQVRQNQQKRDRPKGLGKLLLDIGLPEPAERQQEIDAERLRWRGDPTNLCGFRDGLTAEQVVDQFITCI
ncbi:hypothetical protein B0H13DRAFT_2300336 [Mycena leptocephala]|nr:hypothetical protein B0H13DRAFT_2300336 [Mycena leptocephala]